MNNINLDAKNLVVSSELLSDDDYVFHTELRYCPFIVLDALREMHAESLLLETKSPYAASHPIHVQVSRDLVNWKVLNLDTANKNQLSFKIKDDFRFIKVSSTSIYQFWLKEIVVCEPSLPKSYSFRLHKFGYVSEQIYYPMQDNGFFSCLSTTLLDIASNPYNINEINNKFSFNNFKSKPLENNWLKLFQPINHNIVPCVDGSLFGKYLLDNSDYKKLDLNHIRPLIKKYFSISEGVEERVNYFINKYSIDCGKTIGVCYRGTDKKTEVEPAPIEMYISKIREILRNQPDYRIMIQTDQMQIRDILHREFKDNSFYLEELPVTGGEIVMHRIIDDSLRGDFGFNLLASISLLSRCEHLVTHTGNVGYWTVLYRNESENFYQF